MKQHISPELYVGWTVRQHLFNPPYPAVLKDLALGTEAFSKKHPGVYLFPDPFLQADGPPSEVRLADLEIAVADFPIDRKLAEALRDALETAYGIIVPVVDAATRHLPSATPLLLVGGAESNPLTMQLAKKYQVGFFCSMVPGAGGWGVTTYSELEAGAAPCLVISADPAKIGEAVQFLVQNVVRGPDGSTLRWMHHIAPGPELRENLGSFDEWIGKFRHDFLQTWIDGGRQQPYREAFVAALSQDFSEGLPYNAVLLDLPMEGLRHYQMTGDAGGLQLFREMMWGFWNYLNLPDPQIYISDMDFRLGLLINYWSWIQHNPKITDEERSVFPKVLLAASRMVRDYYVNLWLESPPSALPINHVTFKVRSLLLAARYFRNRTPLEAEGFQARADEAFGACDLARSKHSENAYGYESFMPEHLLCWLEAGGSDVPPAMQQALAIFALRDWAMLDNFHFPVEYGDADPILKRIRPFEVSPWLHGNTPEQQLIRDLERSSTGLFPAVIAPAFRGFTGLHHSRQGVPFSEPTGWMNVPLDRAFAGERSLEGPADQQFDKLAWRSGWTAESAYLAMEGIGNQETAAHSHNEANSILRMNFAGRIWLVNNGYGRLEGIKDAQASFATRKRGPADHNMLVVRSLADGSAILPPPNAVLRDCSEGPIPYSVTEMSDYGGVGWRRHIFVLPGRGVLVVDRVQPLSETPPPFELQWNVLGERAVTEHGAVVEQAGVQMVFQHCETAQADWQESSIAIWRRLIASGEYPHTRSIPSHCTLRQIGAPTGTAPFFFACGFWAGENIPQMVWDANAHRLELKACGDFQPLDVIRDWGRLTGYGADIRIDFT